VPRTISGVAHAEESVAVVVTTFNDADFLEDALNSIVRQTRRASEIIVVDDGSDESPEPIVAAVPGAILIRKKNGGLSSARNAGLHAARSQYIAFLDADDRLEPNAVTAGLACFAMQPKAVMVYGGHRRIDAAGKPLTDNLYRGVSKDPYADMLGGNIVGMHATALYRRDALLTAGGFDEKLRRCEDYDLYLRLARSHLIASHPALVAEYRWHGRNMSRDTAEMLRTVLAIHDEHRDQPSSRRVAWRKGRRFWTNWYERGQQMEWDGSGKSLRSTMGIGTLSGAPRIARGVNHLSNGRLYRLLRRYRRGWPPALGEIDFGQLGSTRPVSSDFGWERGTAIDRYYVEKFLERCASDVRGRVLEIGDDAYSRRYGAGKITHQDVLHVKADNANATLAGDLTQPGVLPDEAFDCIVLTQTLHLIFELDDAVSRLHAALKPGGVLLLTVPGISQIDRHEWADDWCWAFTPIAIRRLFGKVFAGDALAIEAHGNVFAAIAYLTGAALEEVDTAKLDVRDSAYPVIVTLRAEKR
jgi:glycosyltransferase involved in cell wall biosynthesis/SAM-dependent methyltransferase